MFSEDAKRGCFSGLFWRSKEELAQGRVTDRAIPLPALSPPAALIHVADRSLARQARRCFGGPTALSGHQAAGNSMVTVTRPESTHYRYWRLDFRRG